MYSVAINSSKNILFEIKQIIERLKFCNIRYMFSNRLNKMILLHFLLSVKAAPHACVIRTNPS